MLILDWLAWGLFSWFSAAETGEDGWEESYKSHLGRRWLTRCINVHDLCIFDFIFLQVAPLGFRNKTDRCPRWQPHPYIIYSLSATRPLTQQHNLPSFKQQNTSLSSLIKAELAAIPILIMRIKQGPGLTIRSLFSRRSKQAKNEKSPKRCSTSGSDHSDSLRTRPRALDKELEILGLLVDPRKEIPPTPIPHYYSHSHSQPRPSSASARRPKTATTPPPHNLSLYPGVHTYQDSEYQGQEHRESTASSTQSHEYPHHPPSPLLPPTPSLWLPLQTQRAPQQPAEPDLSIPSSPALSSRTFATRSSGIFPWGAEPHAVEDDTLLDDQVLVLPSPPRFARSYGWGGV